MQIVYLNTCIHTCNCYIYIYIYIYILEYIYIYIYIPIDLAVIIIIFVSGSVIVSIQLVMLEFPAPTTFLAYVFGTGLMDIPMDHGIFVCLLVRIVIWLFV